MWNGDVKKEDAQGHRGSMIKELLPMAVFLAMLVFFGVWQIVTPDRSYSASERRLLAQKKKPTVKSVLDASYMAEHETYLTDQFPMRDRWITVKTYCGMLLGQRESGGVYIARDESLIELHKPESVDDAIASRNEEALLRFVQDMRACGAQHVSVMLVPTADSIWSNKISAYADVIDQKAYTERLTKLLAESGSSESYVDVWGELSRHAQEPIYYKTDHHWTMQGAYYGYLSYLTALAASDKAGAGQGMPEGAGQGMPEGAGLSENQVPAWEDYGTEVVRSDFHGTTAAKCGLYHIYDDIVLIHPENRAERYEVVYDLGASQADSLYNYKQAAGDDPYSVYLDGNHAITEIAVIREHETMQHRSLLLIKDSYANCFVPFLTGLYDEITMIDLRYYNAGMRALMEERGYTDVLVLYNLPNFLTERTVFKLES